MQKIAVTQELPSSSPRIGHAHSVADVFIRHAIFLPRNARSHSIVRHRIRTWTRIRDARQSRILVVRVGRRPDPSLPNRSRPSHRVVTVRTISATVSINLLQQVPVAGEVRIHIVCRRSRAAAKKDSLASAVADVVIVVDVSVGPSVVRKVRRRPVQVDIKPLFG